MVFQNDAAAMAAFEYRCKGKALMPVAQHEQLELQVTRAIILLLTTSTRGTASMSGKHA